MRNFALHLLILIVRLVAAFIQSALVIIFYFIGLMLVWLAFSGQPPWYSTLFLICGLVLTYFGYWLFGVDLPTPSWWKKLADSLS